jgi:transcriptional regulator of acetoin/glycerol metabolism
VTRNAQAPARRPRQASPILPPIVRAVLDARDEGIAIFDRDGRVLFLNAHATATHGPQIGAIDGPVLRARLLANRGRVVPLAVGGTPLGELFVVPDHEPRSWAHREREAIHETLARVGGKRGETARQLGISRTTLWRRLRDHQGTRAWTR